MDLRTPGPAADDRRLGVDGRDVGPLEWARSGRARRKGLLGRDGIEGGLLLRASSIHTIGMRFTIDVAFCSDRRGAVEVVAVNTIVPGRVSRPRLGTRLLLEAEAGSFERWGLVVGSHLEVGPI